MHFLQTYKNLNQAWLCLAFNQFAPQIVLNTYLNFQGICSRY